MQNPNEIKKRIKSVDDIGQMTRAMQLVSASKMRRSRALHDTVYPFFSLCAESMLEILHGDYTIDNPYCNLVQKKEGTWKIAYFVLSGEQGLAGVYNNEVVKSTEDHIRSKILDNTGKGLSTDYTLYVFGNIAREKLKKDGYNVDPEFSYLISEPTFFQASEVSSIIKEKFLINHYDLVYLIYTKMKSAINMKPIIIRLVPINKKSIMAVLPENIGDPGVALEQGSEMEYSPDASTVFNFLIDTYLNAMVYGAMVEAYSSEQTARMTAMDNASKNADEMIKKLELMSNRARQSKITNELTEIINGAEQANNI
ncbi:MAG: ATP synthase F1 subunit gamma [Clostridiales bacterium]|nr:ATP synthase F1 subunit gamma [Clostridiales bacterium]